MKKNFKFITIIPILLFILIACSKQQFIDWANQTTTNIAGALNGKQNGTNNASEKYYSSNDVKQENDILGFRVISDRPSELIVEVDYVYSGNMGNQIAMCANVSQDHNNKIGVSPAGILAGRNVAKIYFSVIRERVSAPFTTNELEFYMYNGSSGQKLPMPIVRRFSFNKNWH